MNLIKEKASEWPVNGLNLQYRRKHVEKSKPSKALITSISKEELLLQVTLRFWNA